MFVLSKLRFFPHDNCLNEQYNKTCTLTWAVRSHLNIIFLPFSEGAQDFLTLSLLASVIKTLAFVHTNQILTLIIEESGGWNLCFSLCLFLSLLRLLVSMNRVHLSSAWPNWRYHISDEIDLSSTAFDVAVKSVLLVVSPIVHKACCLI